MGGSIPLRLFGRMLDEEESSSSSSCVTETGRAARALREPVRGRAELVRWAAAEAGRFEVVVCVPEVLRKAFVVLERFMTLLVVWVVRTGSPARSANVFLLAAGSGTATKERSTGVICDQTDETYRPSPCA